MEEMLDLHTQIETLIEEKRFKELKALFAETNAIDIAEAFYGLPQKNLIIAFRFLSKDSAADAFAAMEHEEQEMLIRGLTDQELNEVFSELGADDAADIVGEMPANIVSRILKTADSETRHFINTLLRYPEDSAGSIMTPEYVSLRKDITVEQAFAKSGIPYRMLGGLPRRAGQGDHLHLLRNGKAPPFGCGFCTFLAYSRS